MKDTDGWVMPYELNHQCSDCLQTCDDHGMYSCMFGYQEFPNATKCIAYVPEDIAEGG